MILITPMESRPDLYRITMPLRERNFVEPDEVYAVLRELCWQEFIAMKTARLGKHYLNWPKEKGRKVTVTQ